jgi:hypothetical protein
MRWDQMYLSCADKIEIVAFRFHLSDLGGRKGFPNIYPAVVRMTTHMSEHMDETVEVWILRGLLKCLRCSSAPL